jgi:site-specific recombinase XerD
MAIPTLLPATPLLQAKPLTALTDQQRLCERAEAAVAAFFREGRCLNTARSYKTALQYWGAWHALRFGSAITPPVTPTVVVQFIVDHLAHQPDMRAPQASPYTRSTQVTQQLLPPAIDRLLVEGQYKAKIGPWSIATIETRLAALSKAHEYYIAHNAHLKWGPDKNPLRDARVRQVLSAARRTDARRGQKSLRPMAATREVMGALLATCGDDLMGKRDRALLLFGWASGGRRRSEIVAASFENVRRDADGFVYHLGRAKTNQSGRKDAKNSKPIQGAAAEALEAWMTELLGFRITHGPIFRRILHDRIVEPLKDGAVREIIRRRARMADQPFGKLSAHSLRSGFVAEAGKQGISLGETMTMTGYRSVQSLMAYYQSAEISTSRAARLLDRED